MTRAKTISIWKIAILIIILFAPVHAMAEEKKPAPENIATVNGVTITQADFDRELNQVRQRISRQRRSISEEQLTDIKELVFKSLIDQELLFQESQKLGIQVEKATINESFEKFKKAFNNETDYTKSLTDMNLTETELLSKIKRGMAINKFIDTRIADKIEIPEKDNKAFFNAHPEYFKLPEQVKARHILIKMDPGSDEATRTQARNKIEKIREQFKAGEDFGALAKKYSEGPSKAKEGDLGFFSRGQMVKSFEDAAFALKPGEISDIVETQFGLHLIQVMEKKPPTDMRYEDVRDKIAQFNKQEKTKQEVGLYVKNLREKADIVKSP